MTDKQFTRRLAKLNSSLFDCICEAEELLSTEQAKQIKNKAWQGEKVDDSIIILQELYNQYTQDSVCDCDLHSATLSDITRLVEHLYKDE